MTELHRQRQPHVLGPQQAQLDAGLAIELTRHELTGVNAFGISRRQASDPDQQRTQG